MWELLIAAAVFALGLCASAALALGLRAFVRRDTRLREGASSQSCRPDAS